MGKLSLSSPRLGFSTDRARAPAPQAEGPVRTQISAPWRAWYKTKRWCDLRQSILIRDNYTCQRSGRVCSGKHPDPDSPVGNHKRPHRGNEALFWDPANLETVTKAVHDSLIQSEEQASRHTQGVWD